MDFAVTSKADIDRLSVGRVVEKLDYVDQALRILRRELGDRPRCSASPVRRGPWPPS